MFQRTRGAFWNFFVNGNFLATQAPRPQSIPNGQSVPSGRNATNRQSETQDPVFSAGMFPAAPTGLKARQTTVFLYGLYRVIQYN